ncbi:hypothetical protein AGMMS49938_11010 [Fibrobacterales bacterium]|nr:hypothetical protein AGMMS49938_11010 [Fibrobacterales bacterium]
MNHRDAADYFGKVEKDNYLAHSIRKIEFDILTKQSKHYHIISKVSTTSEKSKIMFFDNSCLIWLPCNCDTIKDEEIRLTLAHELGHVIFNIEALKNPEILGNHESSVEEEQFAWEFAFHLIKKKSDEHRDNINRKKFVYDFEQLKDVFCAIVRKKAKQEVYDSVKVSLNL